MTATAQRARKPRFIAGGDDEDDFADQPAATGRQRYPCAAHGCPKTAGIFLSGGSNGVCTHHYAQNPSKWSRITEILVGWRCVSYEIQEAYRVLTDQDLCMDAKAQDQALRNGWERLQPVLVASGWAETKLAPTRGMQLGQWARGLEQFIAEEVAVAINQRKGHTA